MAQSAVFSSAQVPVLTLAQQVQYLVHRAQSGGFLNAGARFWSLAELKLTSNELSSVAATVGSIAASTWARTLTQHDPLNGVNAVANFPVSGVSSVVSRRSGAGLLLLVWITDQMRRNGDVGQLWSCLSRSGLAAGAERELFLTNGYGTAEMLESLEYAVRFFRLRHRLDDERVQRWYDTCSLQIGFPSKAIPTLPLWIDGLPSPIAVESLLRGAVPNLRSDEFQTLWAACAAYRKAPNSSRALAALSVELQQSPWVLSTWSGAIINALSSVQAWVAPRGFVPPAQGCAATPALTAIPGPEILEIVQTPTIRWPVAKSAPSFFTDTVSPFPLIDTGENVLDLFEGGVRVARFSRNNPSLPFSTATKGPVELRLLPSTHVILCSRSGQTVASQDLELWDHASAFQWFDLATGAPVSTPTLANQDHVLSLGPGLTVSPTNLPVHTAAGRRFYRVAASQRVAVQIHHGTQLLWSHSSLPTLPPALNAIQATAIQRGTAQNPNVQISATAPAGVTISGLSSSSNAMARVAAAHWQTQICADDLQPTLHVQIEADFRGNHYRVSRAVDVFDGGVRGQDPAEFLDAQRDLDVEDGYEPTFRTLSRACHNDRGTLLAGDLPISRRSTRRSRLGSLPGNGESLDLLDGAPFEGKTGQQAPRTVRLARAITHHGLIERATVEPGQWLVTLRREIELDPERHKFVVWHRDGRISLHGFAQQVTESHPARQISILEATTKTPQDETTVRDEPRAIALVYGNSWLGSWWSADWSTGLGELAARDAIPIPTGNETPQSPNGFVDPMLPEPTALALRWFRLPLLHPSHVGAVTNLLLDHTPRVLKAWLVSDSFTITSDQLDMPSRDEGWYSALRSLCTALRGAQEGSLSIPVVPARAIVRALGDLLDYQRDVVVHLVFFVAYDHVERLGADIVYRLIQHTIQPLTNAITDSEKFALRLVSIHDSARQGKAKDKLLKNAYHYLVENAAGALGIPPREVIELVRQVTLLTPVVRRALCVEAFRQVCVFRILGQTFSPTVFVYP